MKLRRTVPVLFALPVLVIALSGFLPQETEAIYGKIARTIAYEMPRQHLSHRSFDNEISRRMLDNYISALDYDRIYFLASDIETFNRKQDELDDELKDGDIKLAAEIFDVLIQRVRNRLAFTEKLLAGGFDFAIEETYRWKRKEAPWCTSDAEWDELWRKRIKNEYLQRLIAKTLNEAPPAAINLSPTTNETAAAESAPAVDTLSPATNEMASVDAKTAADSAAEDEARERERQANLSPEEFISDRYTQLLHILEDSDDEWVVQKYLTAFAQAFDPHSDYMSPSSAEDFQIEMKLSLVGIGAMLRTEDGTAKIVSLLPGGPAANDKSDSRLRPGDKIIAVAQGDEPSVSIMHWPLYRAVRLIRGAVGSRVVLTVISASDPTGSTTKIVSLIRDEVKLEEREAKSRIETCTGPDGRSVRIGIIVLPGFYADMTGKRYETDYKSASRDVATILRKMRSEKVDGIVLDLRNNGGGSLIEAVLMTGLFIESGPVVLVKEQRNINILPDNDPTIAYGGPLAVLVNRTSASASEILAAALQDYGRAIIIGDSKTHGKGTVQTVLPLGRGSDMGSIKVTSALFYRITGGSTQLKGVEPDIVAPSAYDYMEFGEDSLSHPLPWSTVQPVMFSPFDDLGPVIKDLKEKSEKRRAQDERYTAYRGLMGRIETMNKDEEISLNFEIRKERAKTEKELLDIQNRLIDQDTDEKDNPPDLIEEEALHILTDLIEIKSPAPAPAAPALPETAPEWESAQSAK